MDHRFTAAAVAGTLALAATAAMATVPAAPVEQDRLDAALAHWDVRTAREVLDAVEPGARSRFAVAWGYVHLLEGDYRRAEDALARAPAGDPAATHLLALVRATRAATRDLVRFQSPSGRFVVSYRQGADEAVLPYLVEAADASFEVLAARLPARVATPIRVELLPSIADLSAASGVAEADIRRSGAVAVCKFDKLMMVSPSVFPWGYPYADTVSHELVHYVLTVRDGDGLPVWFQEAAAKYLESAWRGSEPGALHRTMRDMLASAEAEGRLIPVTTLRESLVRLGGALETALAFAELSSFAGYLERTCGPDVLPRLADELSHGDGPAAVRRATGRTMEDLSAGWERELAASVSAAKPQGASGVVLREVEDDLSSRLGPDAAGLLRAGDLLRAAGRARAAAIEYRKVVAAMPEPHPAAVARLAGALVDAGAPAEAIAALDQAGLDEDEFALLAGERGRALAALGRPQEAVVPLMTAVRCDPYDPLVHEALQKVFTALGQERSAERERRLAALWR